MITKRRHLIAAGAVVKNFYLRFIFGDVWPVPKFTGFTTVAKKANI